MFARPRKVVALVVVAALVPALLPRARGPEEPSPPPVPAPDWPRPEALRILAKWQVAGEVAAGRLSLLKAAALFAALNRLPPAAPALAELDRYPSSLHLPLRTDEERLCGQVADWVSRRLWTEDPARARLAVARLEGEFREELRRHGAIRLPHRFADAQLPALLDRARLAWFQQERLGLGPPIESRPGHDSRPSGEGDAALAG
jgi:hypothetical protein